MIIKVDFGGFTGGIQAEQAERERQTQEFFEEHFGLWCLQRGNGAIEAIERFIGLSLDDQTRRGIMREIAVEQDEVEAWVKLDAFLCSHRNRIAVAG